MSLRSLKRRVAFLIDAIEDDYQAGIVRGVQRAAERTNVQIVCIAGGVLPGARSDHRSQRNFLFDAVDSRHFEGVLALSGALGNQLGAQGFAHWLERFPAVPVVALGVLVPGVHSISVNGAAGMYGVVSHLIQVHHHRRIAFIRGPASSEEAEQRYDAYRRALDDAGIAFDPRLVLNGTWLRESGTLAVRELLEERGTRIEALNAIASANDYMALGALDALAERGANVPSDLAVTGFDDLDITRCAVPPLTTVRQPTEALGRDGLRRLMQLMNGAEEPAVSELSAEIVQRRSCGCLRVGPERPARPASRGRSFEAALVERRTLICAELARVAHGALFGVGSGWEYRLIAAVTNDLIDGGGGASLTTAMDQILTKLQRAGGDIGVCQQVLSELRREIQDCAAEDSALSSRVADLFDAARELVSEALIRTEISRKIETLAQLREFSQTAALLVADGDLALLRRKIEERFRALGITAFALGLFTEPGRATPDCLCLAAYNSGRQFLAPETFRTNEFGPSDLFENERGTLLVQPLVFDGEPMGIATVVLGSFELTVFEQLREILGVALRGFRLASAKVV